MDDLEKIYKRHKREKVEPSTITVDRFTLDGKPSCMAWYGSKRHPSMMCRFIMTTRFGTLYHCGLSGDRLPDEMTPINNCPLWGETDISR